MKKQKISSIYNDNSLPFDIFDDDLAKIDINKLDLSPLSCINIYKDEVNIRQDEFSDEEILIIAKAHFNFAFLTLLFHFNSSKDIPKAYSRNNEEKIYEQIVSLCAEICKKFDIKTSYLEIKDKLGIE
jgi:hypothetical protein